jgi:hypothetical protein
MISKIGFFLGIFLLTTLSFAQKKKVTQGINGKVIWKAGNFMPQVGVKPSTPKGLPVVREVYIYQLTNEKQTEPAEEAGFYRKINSKLVKKVKSDKKGMYSVTLPMGYYSLFTKEEKGFYANLFDDAMNINPVQVHKGKWAKFEFVIDYQAVY